MEKLDHLRAAIARLLEFPPDDLSPGTRFGDLVPDSLAFIEFTTGLEEAGSLPFRENWPGATFEAWRELTLLDLTSFMD